MTTIKCRKCGKVYPFNEKICPDCGYDIRKDETLSPRDRAALGLKSDSALFEELGKENMERWKKKNMWLPGHWDIWLPLLIRKNTTKSIQNGRCPHFP